MGTQKKVCPPENYGALTFISKYLLLFPFPALSQTQFSRIGDPLSINIAGLSSRRICSKSSLPLNKDG